MIVVTLIQGEKDTANKNHILRMSATEVEPSKTKPDPLPDTQDFTPVSIGIYLDGIETFSIKDSYWMPTFYIWFRWKSDKPIEPGKNFRLVDGKIEKKDLQTSYTGQDGTRYELYKVVARVNKFSTPPAFLWTIICSTSTLKMPATMRALCVMLQTPNQTSVLE